MTMFCPRCRSEYRAGFTQCANCEVELVAELPPEDAFTSAEAMARALGEKEVQAIVVGNHVDLTEAQRYLSSRRIASVIAGEPEQEGEAPMHHRFFLMVAAEDLEKARDAIHERWRGGAIAEGLLLNDTAPSAGTCPACGVAVPLDVSECPDCGLFLGDAEQAVAAEPGESQ
jgi:hypothetical protein